MQIFVTEVQLIQALFKEENHLQQPIFYVSKGLVDAEKIYTMPENLIFTLVRV